VVGRGAGCKDADVRPSRDPIELLVLANDEFARRLRLVRADDWSRPTPCSEWDVRALVNHVVGANGWDLACAIGADETLDTEVMRSEKAVR
jgi:uncharacterized protein (TIGR03083 family)